MLHKIIEITLDDCNIKTPKPAALTTYIQDSTPLPEGDKRPALVICPGGGYGFVSPREAEPVAIKFSSLGFQCFVLDYSVEPVRFPAALLQLAKSVALVRENAGEWNVDPRRIFICGFSAGGHLCGSLGTLWNTEYIYKYLPYKNNEHRPKGMILSYPVITSGKMGHAGSFQNLTGGDAGLTEQLSLEHRVTADCVPAFIWHTFEDTAVPPENALLMASALKSQGIPAELHMFRTGQHGLSLATRETGMINDEVSIWPELAVRWINSL